MQNAKNKVLMTDFSNCHFNLAINEWGINALILCQHTGSNSSGATISERTGFRARTVSAGDEYILCSLYEKAQNGHYDRRLSREEAERVTFSLAPY